MIPGPSVQRSDKELTFSGRWAFSEAMAKPSRKPEKSGRGLGVLGRE
jgi:hypothetical protein